jgi:tripartite-type tricarboxylate transporter receptor subunit TctC
LALGRKVTPPIHIVVAYPAGGIVDIVARTVTEQVGRDLKQAIVVEDRPGANSNIGTSVVARSEPDGYTWLVAGPAVLANPSLYKDAGWDVTNFKCVGLAVWNQSVAVVPPALLVKTMAEFVELGRGKPGQLNFGNLGTGSSSVDLSAQELFQLAHIKLTNVGYKGRPPALIDLMDASDAFRDRVAGAGAAAHQGWHGEAARGVHGQARARAFRTCRRSRKQDMPRPAVIEASSIEPQ